MVKFLKLRYPLLPHLGNQRGIALVLTLLVVTLLTALILEFDFRTRLDLRGAANFRDDTAAYLLADSAVEAARGLLDEDARQSSYDAFDELWATPMGQVPVGNGTITVEVNDEDGKFDLNSLKRPKNGASQPQIDAVNNWIAVFERLLVVLEVESEDALVMTDSLLDWLDKNDETEGDGAESNYYESLNTPYRCGNAPLRTLDELGLVRGFTPEWVKKLEPHVTVHWKAAPASGSGAAAPPSALININTASAELLQALHPDISEVMAGHIMEARPFEMAAEIKSIGLQAKVHSLGQDITQVIGNYLRKDSRHFSVTARGQVGDTVRTVRARITRKSVGDVIISSWRVE